MRRSEPNVLFIKKRIENFKLPFKGIVWYSRGIYNGASHFINLLEFWFGEYKNSKIYNTGNILKKNDPEPEFEIELEKGKFIFQPLDDTKYFHNSIDMYCDNYRIRYENSGKKIFLYMVETDKIFPNYNVLSLNPTELMSNFSVIQSNVVENLLLFLKRKKYNLCSGQDGLKTLKIIDKIRRKM